MYFILLILLAAPLLAQDATPEPTPAPEVSPTPATDATPPPEAAAESSATPEPSATPDASDTPDAAADTTPQPSGADEDVIPLPPESGAAETPIVSETEIAPVLRAGPGEALPDSTFADPNAVIPDDLGGAPSGGPPAASAGELERKLKIRYREVRTEVEKDPAVQSLWQQAQSAKSFEDERAALREFYRLLFKKMRKVDKELTARCDAMETAYINRLAQTRLEPTIPLNPPPTPEPLKN